MILPIYLPQIGFVDFILISCFEITFIWFFLPKEFIGKVFSMVSAANLIKVGVMSFIFPFIPSITTNLYTIYLVETTLIFVVGILTSTLIYEWEHWSSSREQAGALAFRVTAISTLVWVTYKNLQPQVFYQLPSPVIHAETVFAQSTSLPYFSVSYLGFITFFLGLMILFSRYRGTHPLNSNPR